jgi:hypothetical protein
MPYVGKAGEPATNSHRRVKVETVATMADISTYNFTSPKSTWPTFTAQRKMRIGSTRTHAPTLYPFLRLSIARGHTSKPNPSILINHGQFRTLCPAYYHESEGLLRNPTLGFFVYYGQSLSCASLGRRRRVPMFMRM